MASPGREGPRLASTASRAGHSLRPVPRRRPRRRLPLADPHYDSRESGRKKDPERRWTNRSPLDRLPIPRHPPDPRDQVSTLRERSGHSRRLALSTQIPYILEHPIPRSKAARHSRSVRIRSAIVRRPSDRRRRPRSRTRRMDAGQAGDRRQAKLCRAVSSAPGGEVEHLDRDPAIVARLDECGDDRAEVHVAHARAAEVHVLRVEMAGLRRIAADQIGDRRHPARCSGP